MPGPPSHVAVRDRSEDGEAEHADVGGRRDVEELHGDADDGAGARHLAHELHLGEDHENVAEEERVAGGHVQDVDGIPEEAVRPHGKRENEQEADGARVQHGFHVPSRDALKVTES